MIRFVLEPLITGSIAANLPHTALAGANGPPLTCSPHQALDEAQRTERAGDLQRLVTMEAAQTFAALIEQVDVFAVVFGRLTLGPKEIAAVKAMRAGRRSAWRMARCA